MNLNFRAIIRWEQLNDKPFSEMNYLSESELLSLLYVLKLNEGLDITYKDYIKNEKNLNIQGAVKELQREIAIINQFQNTQKKQKVQTEDSETKPERIFMKDAIAMLVLEGLDAYFALNDMTLPELPMFMEAYGNKRKNKLEADRMLSFYSVLPHITKGLKQPKDLYRFYWDDEIVKEQISDEDIEIFRMFKSSANL